jgi:hypothetical protein
MDTKYVMEGWKQARLDKIQEQWQHVSWLGFQNIPELLGNHIP